MTVPEAVPEHVPETGRETPSSGTETDADPESEPVKETFPVEVIDPSAIVTSSQSETTSSFMGFACVPILPVTVILPEAVAFSSVISPERQYTSSGTVLQSVIFSVSITMSVTTV